MTNRKSTKRALLGSVVAMVLCLAMLIGATFAWFTDTASTGVNKIQAGNLDVALEMQNADGKWVSAEGKTLDFVKAAGAENEAILWEPGVHLYPAGAACGQQRQSGPEVQGDHHRYQRQRQAGRGHRVDHRRCGDGR